MAATAAVKQQRPLIAGALPEAGAARLAVQFGLALVGTLILTLSAKYKVMLGPVDMSLQTLAVMGLAACFGLRLGVATVALYLFEGAMGLPVFQGTPEKGIGLAYMAGPTGGYLLGFLAMAAIVGWAADRGWDRSVAGFLPVLLAAEAVMMALGFSWLALLIGTEKAWTAGVLPFIVPDLVKVGLAATALPLAWTFRAPRP